VLCDDIELVYRDQVRRTDGAFSPGMMQKIDTGLPATFQLRQNVAIEA
jgi:hypothetical protein